MRFRLSKKLKLTSKLFKNRPRIVVFLFFAIFLFIGVSIFRDYGLSWDEAAVRAETGLISYRDYEYLIKGHLELLIPTRRYFGPVFQVLLVFIEKIFNLSDSRDVYFMRHLVTFMLFYTSVFFFYLLSKQVFSSWKIGLLGSLFLILSPRIFAHSFYNPKDIPFFSMFVISIYTLIKYLDKKTFLRASLHALTCAILIDIRILGILVPCFTFLFVLVDLTLGPKSGKTKIRSIIPGLLLYVFLLIFFIILFWPKLWAGPIFHFIEAYREMSRFPWGGSVLYLGSFVRATELPWHYIPVWLIITTPVLYTLSFFVGLFISIKLILRKPLNLVSNHKRNDLIVLLWFFLPLYMVIVLNSVLYDAWRQMFFIYPAFLIISLRGLVSIFEFIKLRFQRRAYKIVNTVFIVIVLLSLIRTTQFMVKNHPYQNIYFNSLAGKDMESIKENFELDYWGLSYRRALEYVLKNDEAETINVNVANLPGKHSAQILNSTDRARLRYVELDEAEYFLSNYRGHPEEYPFRDELYSIKVGGAKIMVVYKLKK